MEGEKVQDAITTRDHHTIQFYNNMPQNIGVKGPISHPPTQVQANSWHHPQPSPSSIVVGPTKAVEKSTSLSSREIPEDKHPEILDMPFQGSVPAIPAWHSSRWITQRWWQWLVLLSGDSLGYVVNEIHLIVTKTSYRVFIWLSIYVYLFLSTRKGYPVIDCHVDNWRENLGYISGQNQPVDLENKWDRSEVHKFKKELTHWPPKIAKKKEGGLCAVTN